MTEYGHPKILYERNSVPLGIGRTWNRAVDLAKSEFVTLFHADDVMEREFVAHSLGVFEARPNVAAVHCRTRLVDSRGRAQTSLSQLVKAMVRPHFRNNQILLSGDSGLASLVRADWIMCPTLTYRSRIIKELRFDESLIFALDLDLLGRFLLAGHSIVGINAVDYKYRVHSQSQTSLLTKTGERFREECYVINQLGSEALKRGWHRSHRLANRKTILRLHLFWKIVLSTLQGRLKLAKRLTELAISLSKKTRDL